LLLTNKSNLQQNFNKIYFDDDDIDDNNKNTKNNTNNLNSDEQPLISWMQIQAEFDKEKTVPSPFCNIEMGWRDIYVGEKSVPIPYSVYFVTLQYHIQSILSHLRLSMGRVGSSHIILLLFWLDLNPTQLNSGQKILIHTWPDGSRVDPTRPV
jgi:hypothetical protein